MIILGIDPGTHIIGYGVVEYKNNKFYCLDFGVMRNKGPDKGENFIKTFGELKKIISIYKPEGAAVEKLYFFKNQKTVMGVSEMRGAILLNLAQMGVPIFECTPMQVKQAVSGYGKAEKVQVMRMVKVLLGVKEDIKPDDAADALAIAIWGALNIPHLTMLQKK